MTYELYTISGAPRPWRVGLALVAKGIAFTPRILDASQREHKAPAFLALNPRGRTPVLVDGELVLTESLAIIAYLDSVHPNPPLFGETTLERTRVWTHVFDAEHDLREAAAAINGPVFKGASGDELHDPAQRLSIELRRLDERLADVPFLSGERITAVDCVAFPEVRLTLRAVERAPEVMQRLEVTIPERLRRWVDRIEALPGYEQTFPAHWRRA